MCNINVIHSECGGDESDEELLASTRKRRRLCSELALKTSLESGLYTEFLGAEGPAENHDPESNSALDYLLLLWPESLSSLIALRQVGMLGRGIVGIG